MGPRTLNTHFDATFDVKTLIAAINRIKPAAAAKRVSSLPVLHSCFFEATPDGQVRVSTTDLDLWLSSPVEATVHFTDEPTVLLPNFTQLLKFLTSKKTGEVRITGDDFDESDGSATVAVLASGSTTVRIATAPASEYPLMQTGKGDVETVHLNVPALVDVLAATSTEETRPILCGVNVDEGEYAATDAYRLHVVRTGEDSGVRVLVPNRAVNIFAREAKVNGVTKVDGKVHGGRDMLVKFPDGLLMQTRVIEGEFPNYKGLIPVNPPAAVSWADISEVRTAVKEVIGLINVLDLEASPMRWSASDADGFPDPAHPVIVVLKHDVGKAVEQKFTGQIHMEGTTAAFNPVYFHAALEGATFTEIGGVDSLKPWLLTEKVPAIGPTAVRLRLLMPVRVS